jgi:phosphate transport system protein
MGDYAKEIALVRLPIGYQQLIAPSGAVVQMADEVCELLGEVLAAFGENDVAAAEQIGKQTLALDRRYDEIVEMITEGMTDKKTKHFERGANLLRVAYHLKRAEERVTNIAERIIFVRTGALAELDREG